MSQETPKQNHLKPPIYPQEVLRQQQYAQPKQYLQQTIPYIGQPQGLLQQPQLSYEEQNSKALQNVQSQYGPVNQIATTISDDQSIQNKVEERQLHVLRSQFSNGKLHQSTTESQVVDYAGVSVDPNSFGLQGSYSNSMTSLDVSNKLQKSTSNNTGMNAAQMQQMNANMMARQRALNIMQASNRQYGNSKMMPGPQNYPLQQPKALNTLEPIYSRKTELGKPDNMGMTINPMDLAKTSSSDTLNSEYGDRQWTDVAEERLDGIGTELGQLSDFPDEIGNLTIEQMQACIQYLTAKVETLGDQSPSAPPLRIQELYRIQEQSTEYEYILDDKINNYDRAPNQKYEKAYFDRPEWHRGENSAGRYQCRLPVKNLELFLERNKDVAFIVYHTYTEPPNHGNPVLPWEKDRGISEPEIRQSIRPVKQELFSSLMSFLHPRSEYVDILQKFRSTSEIDAPFIFCYHHRSDFEQMVTSSKSNVRYQLRLFLDHVLKTIGIEYNAVDALLSKGIVSQACIKYLFKPGDTVVEHQSARQRRGWIACGWPNLISSKQMRRSEIDNIGKEGESHVISEHSRYSGSENERVTCHQWAIEAWTYDFEGTFYRRYKQLNFHVIENDSARDTEHAATKKSAGVSMHQITELSVLPLRFCPPNVVQQLQHRGATFWRCRRRQEQDGVLASGEERCIVDLTTYRKLHLESEMLTLRRPDDLGERIMQQESIPSDPFQLLLPPKIKGYNLRLKKWYELWVDRISDVVWKKDTFNKIVMDSKAKEIVRALISRQIETERSTDLIEGKGNGLILLLHGSPGTGKTLTAESVAEIAEKPLYRVTCGDIGTSAEKVEKYLDSVFHLAKLWGCVVLLDEADVFLEQRDLKDLGRNALVSVFLLVLEYYEGILILTSNRVGTFDEAFRSRIHLALHYPTLGQEQRRQVWEMFIDRLATFDDEAVNITDLKFHANDLSEEKMNGREIKNVITTARQYARFTNVTLGYAQLQDVIKVWKRFDQYLDELYDGCGQDEIMKEEGIR